MKKKIFLSIAFFTTFGVSIAGYLYYDLTRPPENPELNFSRKEFISPSAADDSLSFDSLIINKDTIAVFKKLKEAQRDVAVMDSVTRISESNSRPLAGRRINIAITGLDSRLNDKKGRADANHIVTIWLDSGLVDIISVPRVTPAPCDLPDTLEQNILANYRAVKGRQAYLRQLASIAKVGRIDYYVEFGFSQAIRLLELMGFRDNAVQMLRVLRSRKSFKTGDYQRSYNQGQFIRQMILSQFHKIDGFAGDVLMRGALAMVETNLSFSNLKEIVTILREKGFPHNPNEVSIRLRPKFTSSLVVFNFESDSTRNALMKYVEKRSPKSDSGETFLRDPKKVSEHFISKIKSAISKANANRNRPSVVISSVRGIYDKRAWNQIADEPIRNDCRKKVCELLMTAYQARGDSNSVSAVRNLLESEERLDELLDRK